MNRLGAAGSPFFFAVSFNGEEACIEPATESPAPSALFNINGKTNFKQQHQKVKPEFHFERFPETEEAYSVKFRQVMDHIHAGDTYLLNLTACTPLQTSLSIEDIFHASEAMFKVMVPGRFVVFSPEIFARITDNTISGFPMKGTIDADIPDAGTLIMNDPKEEAEHNTIVDLIRNDLGIVAEKISVNRFRFIDKISTNNKTLLQVSSEITGQLRAGWQSELGTLLYKMLPAGSVTGAPKAMTTKIIQKVEGYDRGFYTGIAGYFDGCSLDSGVMIRFIEVTAEGLVFKSGGGITFQSQEHEEYKEMIDKVYVPII
jgi:para-aminobenzoate synthetase component I